jgi:hypothetical protein
VGDRIDLGPEAVCQVRRAVMIQARESKSTPLPVWGGLRDDRGRARDEDSRQYDLKR